MRASDELDRPLVKARLSVAGHDIDLIPGEKLVGRAPDCDLIIDDPLVSRQHARIWCDGKDVVLVDLGSRNGSRVNGTLIRQPTILENGDRIQIGGRELLFSQESGFSEVRIPVARRANPDEAGHAIRTGSEPPADPESGAWSIEEQITVVAWVEPGHEESSVRWPVQMLAELAGKAILSGRERDVAGIMEQAVISVDRALEASEPIKLSELDALRDAAKWLHKVQHSDYWLRWIAKAYVRAGHAPRGIEQKLMGASTLPPASTEYPRSSRSGSSARRAPKGRPGQN
jgi:hypothetical protein